LGGFEEGNTQLFGKMGGEAQLPSTIRGKRKLGCLEMMRKGWERRISCHMFSRVLNVPTRSQLTSL
jgi:hypothetical protein